MKKLLLLNILVGNFIAGLAQTSVMDLSRNVSIIKETVDPGSLTLRIKYLCPGNTYRITIKRKTTEITPLNLAPDTNAVKKFSSDCSALKDAMDKVYKVTAEEKLPIPADELKALLDNGKYRSCPNYGEGIALSLRLDTTIETKISAGEEVEIIVSRKQRAKDTSWSYIFSTKPRGVWRTTYGFNVVPNWFSREERYFLDSNNAIKRENSRKLMDYAPSILFTWFPESRSLKNFSYGLTAGLGLNFNLEPQIFTGFSMTYNQNISLNLGLVAYRQSFLKGRYKEGDIIKENNFDQETGLHEKLFRINPFIGISFRLNQSPFNTSGANQ